MLRIMEDWIAVAGVRAVDADATHTAVPDAVMHDPRLSLEAKGLYMFLASYQGQPIDPYEDRVEDEETIARAIEELIDLKLAVRLSRP